MQPHQIKRQVASAIDDQDLRKAIRIMDNIREAHELMSELPRAHLEALRDALHHVAEDRAGPRGALNQAWYEYTQQALEDARRRERRDVFGMYQDTALTADLRWFFAELRRGSQHPLRKAIRIMDNIREAHELMSELPCAHLEALRDALHHMAEDRTGPRGALNQAWYEYAQQALEDACRRGRQDVFAMYQDIKR